MDEVRIRYSIEDVNVEETFNRINTAGKQSEASMAALKKQGEDTSRAITEGFAAQEQAILKAAKAESELIRQILKQEQQIARLEKQRANQIKTLEDLERKYQKLGKAGSSSAVRVKKQIDLLAASIEDTDRQLSDLTDQNIKASEGLEKMAGSSDRAATKLNAARKSSGLLSKATGLLKGGIAGLAVGLVSLIGVGFNEFLKRSEKGSKAWGQAVAFVGGVLDELLSRLVPVGEAFIDLLQGQGSLLDVGRALVGVFGEQERSILEAGNAAVAYQNALDALKRSQTDFITNEAEITAQIDRQRRISSDQARSIRQRLSALQEAARLERDLEQQRIRLAERELELIRDRNTTVDGSLTVTEEIAQAERELIELRRDAAAREFADEMAIRDLRNEAAQASIERKEAMAELAKETQAALDRLRGFQETSTTGVDKVRQDTINAIGEVQNLERVLRDLYQQQGIEFNLDEEIAATIRRVSEKGEQEIERLQRDRRTREAKEAQARLDAEKQAELRRIDQLEELGLVRAENNRRLGLTEIEAEQAKEREKLHILIDATRQRLALLEDQNSAEAQLYRENIESYQQAIEQLGQTDLTFIEQLGEKIRMALNLSEEDFVAVTGLFANFGNFLVESATLATDRQIEQQERLIDSYRDRVEETQNLLNEELQLNEEGLANDAGLLQQRLEQEQQALEDAENQKLALQRKSANQQLKIEAAQQASAYLTTVLNLLASESKTGIVGLIAVAAGGLALIGNIVAKARANSEAFAPAQFRYGTEYVTGPGTGSSDSVPARLGVGERVLKYEHNQALGGKSTSNNDVVHFFQLGKELSGLLPDFTVIDQKTSSAIAHGKEVSRLEREQVMRMQEQAFTNAAVAAAEKQIAYWKTRPVTYRTTDGTVIEYEKGGTKVKQVISK